MKNYLVFSMFIVLLGCQKDTPKMEKTEDKTCVAIPYAPAGHGYDYVCKGICYGPICVNPRNGNEIVVFQQVNEEVALVKHDLKNKTSKVLFKGVVGFSPKWGMNGWILFNHDNEIWRVKSDGDSLTRLTFDTYNFSPEWSLDCSKIFYRDGKSQKTILIDFYGNFIDTIGLGGFDSPCWQHDSLICGAGPAAAGIVNPYQKTGEVVYDFEDGPSGNAVWINKQEFMFWFHEGIVRCNYKTKQSRLLKPTCNSIEYLFASFCPENQKIYFLKLTRSLFDENTLESVTEIVMMNTDGTNETIIDIE